MYKVKITAMRKSEYHDLMAQYENEIEHACDIQIGDTFVSVDGQKPQGFCDSAWQVLYPFVLDLANGNGDFFDGWMRNKYSAMLSCNDGFRPVSFYLERVEEE